MDAMRVKQELKQCSKLFWVYMVDMCWPLHWSTLLRQDKGI